ncbi:MAG TPA: hypothetical protein ENN29_08545 [Candidatus Hydrogenedentes bacterium]|nr:hypothetical protein [Candidatus Hydrogenedentota bacterium]
MDLVCPQCGRKLEVEQIRIAARVQCPVCGAVFRADEGAPRFHRDNIIDVNAEVVSLETEAPSSETEIVPVVEPAQNDAPRERVVFVTRHVTATRNEGCGCGGCGCLALLFLLFLFLFGCAAVAVV